jgi:two-component system NarL family sensor kinase
MMAGATNVSFITCTRLKNLVEGTAGLRYHASIPLYRRQRKVGVLNVARTDWQELSDDDLRLLSTVGDMLSIAIERAELFSRSAQLGAVEERNRLAREIHDTLAQGLTAITLQLETADALIDSSADRARRAIQRALELARANLDEARRSVLDLRAAPLEDRTLPEAIAELLTNCQLHDNMTTEFEHVGGNRPLSVRLQVGLYRITQEALNNIIRHANADHIRITLTAQPDEIELVIADDGDGFDPNHLPEGNRFGLIGLNERANLLGGHLNLCAQPDEGTTLRVVVPTSPEKQTHE